MDVQIRTRVLGFAGQGGRHGEIVKVEGVSQY